MIHKLPGLNCAFKERLAGTDILSNSVDESKPMKRFGEKLRIPRRSRSLTMRQLGETLEVSDSYVSKMETGDKVPDMAMVIKIADLFEADLKSIITR